MYHTAHIRVSKANVFYLFIALLFCLFSGIFIGWLYANLMLEEMLESNAQTYLIETRVNSDLADINRDLYSVDRNITKLNILVSHVDKAIKEKEANEQYMPISLNYVNPKSK